MEAFISRNKRKRDTEPESLGEEDEPTEVKLALLSSLHPTLDEEVLLDILLANDGSVPAASASLRPLSYPKTASGGVGSQTSLKFLSSTPSSGGQQPSPAKARLLSKKGTTLHVYDPVDIADHTPCTIIHNFLPPEEATSLLSELLDESKTFEKITFKLFDNVVSCPHTSCLYVGSADELNRQKYEYVYSGSRLTVQWLPTTIFILIHTGQLPTKITAASC